ncbi:UNVERIFIED_CONTAM: hypothetical protein Scaly_2577300 [Sesamum calycinum]|uniref:Uncharacterized protein n=1 Tax=Sesamum calycinum TaxID=2727403 RepID=A0AAW2JHQ2_9LAMI
MPPGRGADRIGVSLGSHRPTVILKLPCLVEKKRTKVRSLAVLFSVANWDRSPARPTLPMQVKRVNDLQIGVGIRRSKLIVELVAFLFG